MMRDRLIELHQEAGSEWNAYLDSCLDEGEEPEMTYDEFIADYLLENSVMLQPCNMGDKMYCDGKHFASHCSGEILEFPVNYIETSIGSIFRGEMDVKFDFEAFGKTVFLTREEAEQALKGGEG